MAFVIKEYLGYDLSKNISNVKEVKNMACKTRGTKKKRYGCTLQKRFKQQLYDID